ncbi:LysR family transcriptional regulator, partial [Bordetella pertussis]
VSLPDGAGTTRLLDPWLAGGAPAGPRLAGCPERALRGTPRLRYL